MYYIVVAFDLSDADRVAAIVREDPTSGIKWATHQLYIEAQGY